MLCRLSPRLNDAVDRSVDSYSEQANHLRCQIHGVGEIDYLLAGRAIDFNDEPVDVEGLGIFRSMSDREILAQKTLYRGSRFTGRDLFDFATVTALNPKLLADRELVAVAQARRTSLTARLEAEDLRLAYGQVIPHPESSLRIDFDQARKAALAWLEQQPGDPFAAPGPTP